jgi:hypothetical protein
MNGTTTVYFLQGPEATSTPEGPAQLCNSQPGEYTTSGSANATFYIWNLDPPSAGAISGDGKTVTVFWDPGFEGTAGISVQGATDCATGPASGTFQVSVLPAPHPDLTGQAEPCTDISGKVYTYTTPLSMVNDYFWTLEGGELVTGQGTYRALVKWTTTGSGRLIVTESSPNGCNSYDTLEVQIFDCTGMDENDEAQLMLYPNPVEDNLNIRARINEKGPVKIFVFNNTGQEVIQRTVLPENGAIDINISTSALSVGIYNLQLLTKKGIILEGKFVKTK